MDIWHQAAYINTGSFKPGVRKSHYQLERDEILKEVLLEESINLCAKIDEAIENLPSNSIPFGRYESLIHAANRAFSRYQRRQDSYLSYD